MKHSYHTTNFNLCIWTRISWRKLNFSSKIGNFILVAESNFNSEADGDLTITKGDLIIGLQTVDQAWTKGRNLQGHVGIFPTSFCWTPNTDLLFKTKSKVSYTYHKKKSGYKRNLDSRQCLYFILKYAIPSLCCSVVFSNQKIILLSVLPEHIIIDYELWAFR